MPLTTFLDGAQAVQLRGAAFLLLSDTGHAVHRGGSDDGGGGITGTTTAGSTIPCRLKPVGGGEDVIGEAISDRTTHLILVAASNAVTTSDEFVVDNHGTYEITAVRNRTRQAITPLEAVPKT